MNSKQKVLYISQEVTPYLPDTHLGHLCRYIPHRVQEEGLEVRTFMPKYGCINERRNQLHEVIRLSGINIPVDDNDHPLIIKVATLQSSRMQVYFIDNDDYFRHHAVRDLEIRETPEENDERLIFFSRGVMETAKKLRWEPAFVHCSGWVTALAPLYMKRTYANDPTFGRAKVVFSIFNDAFEGPLDARLQEKLRMDGFSDKDIATLGTEPAGWMALNKVAIDYADGLVIAADDVPAELVEYAKASGKPVIESWSDEVEGAPMVEFYNSL